MLNLKTICFKWGGVMLLSLNVLSSIAAQNNVDVLGKIWKYGSGFMLNPFNAPIGSPNYLANSSIIVSLPNGAPGGQNVSGSNGNFAVTILNPSPGVTYPYVLTLTPQSNNTNYMSGVSTYDILLINKHVLGTQVFTTQSQWIAADVNGNGNVATSDVTTIRRLVLGITPTFPSPVPSWVFVKKPFATINQPINLTGNTLANVYAGRLAGVAPNGVTYGYGRTMNSLFDLFDTDENTFSAIKMGDIDGNSAPNPVLSASREDHSMVSNLYYVENGQAIKVTFDIECYSKAVAFQAGLYIDPSVWEVDKLEGLSSDNYHYNKEKGDFRLLDYLHEGTYKAKPQISIILRALKDTKIDGSINFSEELIKNEVYDNDGNIICGLSATISANESEDIGLNVYPNPIANESNIIVNYGSTKNQLATISITDMNGRTIFTQTETALIGKNRTRIQNLDFVEGFYLLKVSLADGKNLTTKFVKVK